MDLVALWHVGSSRIRDRTHVSCTGRKEILQIPLKPPVQFSRSVVSDSLQPHGLQHARPPCPSPTPEAPKSVFLMSLKNQNTSWKPGQPGRPDPHPDTEITVGSGVPTTRSRLTTELPSSLLPLFWTLLPPSLSVLAFFQYSQLCKAQFES